jgi:TIR domain
MRVFISWSGELSGSVAQALRDWLPMVVQHVEPWMSDEDIESGGRWNDHVAAELERADYGIICLTSTNLDRPWLLFEAGALAKRFDVARVVPLLIDLKPADVTMPLASFQGRALSEDGLLRLVKDMNGAREQPLPPQQIDQLFAGMWPTLEGRITAAKASTPVGDNRQAPRETEDVMAELVESVRRMERRMDTLQPESNQGIIDERNNRASLHIANLLSEIAHLDAALQASRIELEQEPEVSMALDDVRDLAGVTHLMGLPVAGRYYKAVSEKWQARLNVFPDQRRGEPQLT